MHSGGVPSRTAWGAHEQHKTASMVRQLSERCGDSAAAYSLGEWHYGLGFAAIFLCAHCNALQVFQG